MVGITSKHAFKERFGLVIVMCIQLELPKLIVRLRLLRLQANRSFKLAPCIIGTQQCGIDIPKAEMRGGVIGLQREIGFVVALGIGHVLLLCFKPGQRVKNCGIRSVQLTRSVQCFIGF